MHPGFRRTFSWRRIPNGWRYLRRYGWRQTVRRLTPWQQSYHAWFADYGRLKPADIAAIRRHIGQFAGPKTISLAMALDAGEMPGLGAAVASVGAQLYPNWELCLAGTAAALAQAKRRLSPGRWLDARVRPIEIGPGGDDAAAFNACLTAAKGEFIARLGTRDTLAPHALYALMAEIECHPDAAIVYSDEDAVDARGRHSDPRHKSDWNPDLFLGQDAIGRLAAYRRDLVAEIGGLRPGFGGAAGYDLALRVAERTAPNRIRHIPLVLYHRHDPAAGTPPGAAHFRRAVAEHLGRIAVDAVVVPLESGRFRVRYRVPEPKPAVSLIVPTRDQVALLSRCVDGLRQLTDYDPLEIIIIDNNSEDRETLAYFASLKSEKRVRILHYPGPFNYSAINNFAVAAARHELIGLINNDIEIIHADWLQEMVSHALRPEIGAVGAKLYYPDDTIQHAGTIVGLHGGADHAFRHLRRDAAGYLDRLVLTQNLSAVTAACMVLRKAVFGEVGGFDAENLPISFNDVDLCLRIRAHGYRIVWTPFAELYHWESASRGPDLTADKAERARREAAYLAARWADVIAHDPYYNPNLGLHGGDFRLAFPPRGVPPWHSAGPAADC